MNLTWRLLANEDLMLFREALAPLAPAALALAPDEERLRRLDDAVRLLGLNPRSWPQIEGIEDKRGAALAQTISFLMYFVPSSAAHVRTRHDHVEKAGSFGVHAWLLESTTGRGELVPRPGADRSFEFHGTHFHRFSWLASDELGALSRTRSWSDLREGAFGAGDAPGWPESRRGEYVDTCIQQVERMLAFLESLRAPGLSLLCELDNTDWEYD